MFATIRYSRGFVSFSELGLSKLKLIGVKREFEQKSRFPIAHIHI